jgi:glycosyltransferase involved in cell wall biosynthesis
MDFVALEIIRRLQRMDTVNQYYILVAPGEDVCLQPSANVTIITLRCPTYPLWEQVALPLAIKRLKPDIIHCTSNTAPLMGKTPLVLTLHDIIYLETRQQSSASWYQNMGWHYRRLVVPTILKRCAAIITVSRFECQRIRESLQLDASRLVPIHNGYGDHFKPIEQPYVVTSRYLKEADYLLFLGNTDPKKNTPRTLKAYGLYVQQTPNPLPLLVADLASEYIDQVLSDIDMPFIRPLLRFSGYIPNTDLPALYTGAKVFLYTSLRESFGIPLLEAMACGTPVVTSNTSSMPEVAGDAALFADPTDEKEIAAQLMKLLTDETCYQSMVSKGLERVKAFSWEATAKATFNVYQSVHAQHLRP